MEKTVLNAIIIFGKIIALVAQFPTKLTIYEFGSSKNSFGGLTWHEPYPPYRAKPYPNSTNGNIAHLFQYLSPELPARQFPMKQFTVCEFERTAEATDLGLMKNRHSQSSVKMKATIPSEAMMTKMR